MFNINLEKQSLRKIIFVLAAASCILKLSFLNINSAEYTDGIIQITLFNTSNTLWPPLYSVFVKGLARLIGNEIVAGKIISLITNSLIIIPIVLLGNMYFGKRAGIYAALLYILSPMPTQWSVRVMTDSLFVFLFFLSIYFSIKSISLIKSNIKENVSMEDAAFTSAFFGIFCAALAALTHYRGILLLPINIINLFYLKSGMRKTSVQNPYKVVWVWAGFIFWLLLPLWIQYRGFCHIQQITERFGGTGISIFLNYLNIFESFLLFSPYYFTYPVFIFLLIGVFKKFDSEEVKEKSENVILFTFLYICISVLIMQSIFQSFQSRYLLPLLPLCVVYAGKGIVWCEQRIKKHQNIFQTVLIINIVYIYLMTLAVMSLQRQAFGDIKGSAEYIKTLKTNLPIYSNETYRRGYECVKMKYWSGRDIKPLWMLLVTENLPKEAIVCVHSAYGGMNMMFNTVMDLKNMSSEVKPLGEFDSALVPLFTDIMEEPYSHQNPMAFVLRYENQTFKTVLYQMKFK